MKRLLASIAIFLFLSGCYSVPLRLPTTTNTEYEILGDGEGSATGIMLLQFIPIGQNERFERAYHYAVKSKGGDALINPVIEERWFWAYLVNGYTTTIKGTVIRYKK